jgi:hypothetical protein
VAFDIGPRRVFTYWEPRGAVTPYLQLCRETWDRSLGGAEIITLDLSNVEEHIGPGALDLDVLSRMSKMMQKDAAMVAVLHRQGGLFLDMDTLLAGDLTSMVRWLRRTGLVSFGGHIGAIAARPGTELLARWLANVQANIRRVASGEVDPTAVRWDYLGNAPLNDALREFRNRSFPRSLVLRGGGAGTPRTTQSDAATRAHPAGSAAARPRARVRWKTLVRPIDRALSRPAMAPHLKLLERRGFIAELGTGGKEGLDPVSLYLRFWFEDSGTVADVFRPGVDAVALHNSWTPDWYQGLTRDEVLAHGCLLSRSLVYLLSR